MGNKKMNCKHGLDRKGEIEARKLRVKLESGDRELLDKVKQLYLQWLKKPKTSFIGYLKEIDKPLASALLRVDNLKEIYNNNI